MLAFAQYEYDPFQRILSPRCPAQVWQQRAISSRFIIRCGEINGLVIISDVGLYDLTTILTGIINEALWSSLAMARIAKECTAASEGP